jgi:hypothetical protein
MGFDITGLGSVFDFAKTVVDKIWPPSADPNAKLQAEAALAVMMQQRENAIVDAQKSIITAEMQSGDRFTQRARPMVVYAGLAFIFLVHVLVPCLTAVVAAVKMKTGIPPETLASLAQLKELSLPEEFWWAWGTCVSIWSLGRDSVKIGLGKKGGLVGSVLNGVTGK